MRKDEHIDKPTHCSAESLQHLYYMDLLHPSPPLSRCLSDTLKPLFQHVNLRQLPVVDRMVFDINRRTILERTRTRPITKERKPSSGQVFNRLIEDTTKRMTAKKPVKEALLAIGSQAGVNNSVYLRLQEDVKARRQSSITRMWIKEEGEKPAKPLPKPRTADPIRLVDRLMEDAEMRRRKIEERKREKEAREVEEAIRLAEMHHPRRKPDEETLRRLLAPHRRAKTGEWREQGSVERSRQTGREESLIELQPERSLPSPSKSAASPTDPVQPWSQAPFYFHVDQPVPGPHKEQRRGKAGVNMS